jgi:hypothetical protein
MNDDIIPIAELRPEFASPSTKVPGLIDMVLDQQWARLAVYPAAVVTSVSVTGH